MQNRNVALSDAMIRAFNLKSSDTTGDVVEAIYPVAQIRPRSDILFENNASNATSATIYTAPSDKFFYLQSACLSLIKDVTATSTVSAIRGFIDGTQKIILNITSLTLTVQSGTVALNFDPPLRLDKGQAITVTNTTAVGNVNARGNIIGYLSDV